jgi:hypothetical protein
MKERKKYTDNMLKNKVIVKPEKNAQNLCANGIVGENDKEKKTSLFALMVSFLFLSFTMIFILCEKNSSIQNVNK